MRKPHLGWVCHLYTDQCRQGLISADKVCIDRGLIFRFWMSNTTYGENGWGECTVQNQNNGYKQNTYLYIFCSAFHNFANSEENAQYNLFPWRYVYRIVPFLSKLKRRPKKSRIRFLRNNLPSLRSHLTTWGYSCLICLFLC